MSYIPGPLAEFLDRLRLELTPDCNPRAHVTVLPPRPIANDADLRVMIARLTEETRHSAPVVVELGDVDVFRATNVIYIGLVRGERELHGMHENLNAGYLEYGGPYPYHPHVTIAQDMGAERVPELTRVARERWAAYDGPRWFVVDCLSFVQNVAPGMWVDVAKLPLALPVGAACP